MVSGSLLIHGPPVISGDGCPTRAVTACPARGAITMASTLPTPTNVSHRLSVFMLVSLRLLRGHVSRFCEFCARGPGIEVGSPPPTPYNEVGGRRGMGPSGSTDADEQRTNTKGIG